HGRAEQARAVLAEHGRAEEARAVLAEHGREAGESSVSDTEIDAAFAAAEADRDCMVDADAVARAAIRQVDCEPADEIGFTAVDGDRARGDAPGSGRFATATMADLLEQQGDVRGADRIRARLEPKGPARREARSSREHVVDTLERWLVNLRGETRR
ncbi:MAG: hypothetical protein VX546_11560, partial [Myxococcota bacterium]|nr:hypothetical protein [Myxococcota bacterium]